MNLDASRLLGVSAGPLDAFMAAERRRSEELAKTWDAILHNSGLQLAMKAAAETAERFAALAEATLRPFRAFQHALRSTAERVRAMGAGLAAVARRGLHRVRGFRAQASRTVAGWWNRVRRREPIPLRPPVHTAQVWNAPPVIPAPIIRHGFTITPNGPPMLPSHDYATDRRLPM